MKELLAKLGLRDDLTGEELLEQLMERQSLAMAEEPFLKAADNYPVKETEQSSDKEND